MRVMTATGFFCARLRYKGTRVRISSDRERGVICFFAGDNEMLPVRV